MYVQNVNTEKILLECTTDSTITSVLVFGNYRISFQNAYRHDPSQINPVQENYHSSLTLNFLSPRPRSYFHIDAPNQEMEHINGILEWVVIPIFVVFIENGTQSRHFSTHSRWMLTANVLKQGWKETNLRLLQTGQNADH